MCASRYHAQEQDTLAEERAHLESSQVQLRVAFGHSQAQQEQIVHLRKPEAKLFRASRWLFEAHRKSASREAEHAAATGGGSLQFSSNLDEISPRGALSEAAQRRAGSESLVGRHPGLCSTSFSSCCNEDERNGLNELRAERIRLFEEHSELQREINGVLGKAILKLSGVSDAARCTKVYRWWIAVGGRRNGGRHLAT